MTDLTSLWRFNRPKLALQLADRAKAKERIALFGPRQTGKTSLLREEVMPLLEKQGAYAIYVECWADKLDPLASINYALQKALDNLLVEPAGLTRKLKRPVKKIGVAGASLEFGEDPSRRVPVSKYLQVDAIVTRLLDETKKTLVLIFDEFQAVAASPDADAASAALRAALTQASKRVGVIFSGSSEVMLLEAFARSKAPLYGFANPEPYPLLGADFVAHVGRQFKKATGRELDPTGANRAFEQLGHQPEPFLNAVANTMANAKWSIEEGLDSMLDPNVRNKWTVNWFSLTDLQRVVLRVVFDGRQPTSAETVRYVAAQLGENRVQPSSLIRAVEALISKGLVEAEITGRGRRYVLSDPAMVAWLTRNKSLPSRALD
jgi:AAA+ ATPase superfamily predicted ATPase